MPYEVHIYSEHQCWLDAVMDYSAAHPDDYAIPCDDFLKLRFGVRFARSDVHFYHQFIEGECSVHKILGTPEEYYAVLRNYDAEYPESSWYPFLLTSSNERGWICFEAKRALICTVPEDYPEAFTDKDPSIPMSLRSPI